MENNFRVLGFVVCFLWLVRSKARLDLETRIVTFMNIFGSRNRIT